VRGALVETGYAPRPKGPKLQRGQPLRVVTEEGMTILVGRSARQNHEVTFRRAGPDDLWLHAVDVPGAHVVILSAGRPVPDAVLRRAAELAAYYSAAQEEASVLVAYTQRRYVRPMRNAGPGMVTYRQEKTIRVRGRAEDRGPMP
jgi:predicted ribosome quality control (RQC) complex YloA/Tae2 family protein